LKEIDRKSRELARSEAFNSSRAVAYAVIRCVLILDTFRSCTFLIRLTP
jgi:hypothetical protein